MGRIVMYDRIPNDKIMAEAVEAITGVEAWFAAHPDRDVCDAQTWYGRRVKIKRPKGPRSKTVAAQINAVRDAALSED
jgi:hypothetical protein